MIKLKNVILNKKYLFKSININFCFTFLSFFIFKAIFATNGSHSRRHQNTELFAAVNNQDINKLQELLRKPQVKIDIEDADGQTLLDVATTSENKKMISLLLEKGANPNIKGSGSLGTPFGQALMFQNLQLVKLFLDAGLDPFSGIDTYSMHDDNPLKNQYTSGNLDLMHLIFYHKSVREKILPQKKLKLIECAVQYDAPSNVVQLLMTSEPQVTLREPITRNFLKEAFKVFKSNNAYLWNNHLSLEDSIERKGIDTFIALLLQYRYEERHLGGSTFQINMPNDVNKLIQKLMHLNTQRLSKVDDKKLLDSAKSLINWIMNEMPASVSPAEFFKHILQYLRSTNHSLETQTLLLDNIRYLALKEYFLNPNISDKSDFEKFKKDLKGDPLNHFKEFEDYLRYIYAHELKYKLSSFIKKEDLMNFLHFDPCINQQNRVKLKSAFNKFNFLSHSIHAIVSYFHNESASSLIDNFLKTAQELHHETIVKWARNMPQIKASNMPLFVEDIFEQDYSQRIQVELYHIYQHLEYIIQTHGKKIDSDTPFRGEDILNFKKPSMSG